MIIATASIKGQVPIIWTVRGERHTVQYGHDETVGISERDACAAFLSCLEHARQSAGLNDDEPDTIEVEYFGAVLIVPSWTKFLACDADGEVYAYSVEPDQQRDFWSTSDAEARDARVPFSKDFGLCPFWHQSLKEVNS